MSTRITESRGAELFNEDNSFQTESGVVASVSQGKTLLPPELLITGEHLLYETRPLLWPLLVSPALLAIVGIIITLSAPNISLEFISEIAEYIPLDFFRSIILWTGITLLFPSLLGAASRYLRWRFTVYTVTNRRIINQTGIIGKSYVDCSLRKVQNVYMDTNILGRIFRFGNIRVAAAGTSGIEIYWKNVKEPMKVHRRLSEAILSAENSGQTDKAEQ